MGGLGFFFTSLIVAVFAAIARAATTNRGMRRKH